MPTSLAACTAILLVVLACWIQAVNKHVPQPYLDEFFHVPQARQYCSGHFKSWDSKITTPPGLYIVAASLSWLLGCSTEVLRVENAICLLALFFSIHGLQWSSMSRAQSGTKNISAVSAHTALNAVFFPPLFFFSALYYTDVPSTLAVVFFMRLQESRNFSQPDPLTRAACLYGLGVVSLFFRQTNIFWVAIFPAAMTTVQLLDQGQSVVRQSMHSGASGFGDSLISIIRTTWKMRVVYDPPIRGSSIEDYSRCIVSLATGAIRSITDMHLLGQLLIKLAPYYTLLGIFMAFVVLNGSVVLGDKSNHVATIHLPQMLYIWPYVLSFSWPLLLPQVIHILSLTLAKPPSSSVQRVEVQNPRWTNTLPRLRYLLVFSLLGTCIIRYNTIIHPFTLADNRHYTFYVFRLLMRPWWMRYAVMPVYAVGAWMCIQSLSMPNAAIEKDTAKKGSAGHQDVAQSSTNDTKTSFVIIWLFTTALQLITAPLVEPRYFILPWLLWRLNIPEPQTGPRSQSQGNTLSLDRLLHALQEQRLWLETIWYLVINATTGYIFLHWGFTWTSEPGTTQRFMW